jgi:hypothetical protein
LQVASDDDQVRAKMRALEAEVVAASEVDRDRKAQARERILARRAEATSLRERQAELLTRRGQPTADRITTQDQQLVARMREPHTSDLDQAVALARRAGDVKAELAQPVKAGEKSWLISTALSFFFGPLGWLYAGAFRETIPASVVYVMVAGIVSKILPMFLLMPVMMVLLPVSGIAGLVYAIGHNRAGKRIRLFGDDPSKSSRLAGPGARRPLPPSNDD